MRFSLFTILPALIAAAPASASFTTLSGVVSDHYSYSLGRFYSGGTGCCGYSNPIGYDNYFKTSFSPDSTNSLDHSWMQGDSSNGVTWELTTASSTVVAFGAIDHGPVPIEAYEFAIYGSNDLEHWTAATMTFVVEDGWVDSGAAEESDDWSSIWQFEAGEFRYIRALANYDGDFEMDAVGSASAVPAPGIAAVLAGGLAMRRRRRD